MRCFTGEQLRSYCTQVLTRAGISPTDAATVADCLVDADLSGVESHGVSRLSIYLQRLDAGVVEKENRVRVLSESPAALAVDAGNCMGAVGATFAMKKCIEKAAQAGSCWATVKSSNHFGTAAYYTKMAASAGMIGIAMTNVTAKIAPWGSSDAYMGTNPISIAVPSEGLPVVLDMAPSVVAMGKLILAQKLGKSIPEGWALGPDGKPTTDPAVGRKGTMVPIGGPKGSGLAIFVDIFCGVLSGGEFGPHLNDLYADMVNPQGVGHIFCAIDISKFVPLETFRSRIFQMSKEIKALHKKPGVSEIFMPGEIECRRHAERLEKGIEISDAVYAELQEIGARYGVSLS